jgi:O-methyltransferase domain
VPGGALETLLLRSTAAVAYILYTISPLGPSPSLGALQDYVCECSKTKTPMHPAANLDRVAYSSTCRMLFATRPALIQAHGLADRITIEAGNFFESIPTTAGAYLLSHIIHDWSEAQCLTILATVAVR